MDGSLAEWIHPTSPDGCYSECSGLKLSHSLIKETWKSLLTSQSEINFIDCMALLVRNILVSDQDHT